jgi:uncharacterized protein YdeI (YjbR/CyaY-like superfamily)
MPKPDPRIDAYIAEAAVFAKPILIRIRKLVHAACPDVTETIKWGSPFYEHKGILLCTPAFKKHCALIFWKGQLLFKAFPAKDNPRKKFRRLTSNADLPGDKILTSYIKQAVALHEAGIKNSPRTKSKARRKLVVPDYFLAALKKNKKALATFENFSPSHKREYVEWLAEAKREAARTQRLQTAIEWLVTGKSRHWKYQQK